MNSVQDIRKKLEKHGLFDFDSDDNPIFDLVMEGDHYTKYGWESER